MPRSYPKARTTALIAALALSATSFALAAGPAVQGPESVEDWYKAGQKFIQDGYALKRADRLAKNVILFVGDGMGVSTVTAARILEGQLNGKPGEENRLFFETFPYVALSKTYSWDQQTSDSAPTMTAMVTGYKAREGMLSVNHTTARFESDAKTIAAKSLPTILEQAAAAGKHTGVVSTARLTHATPAANYAHTAVRDWESDKEIRDYEAENGLPGGTVSAKDIARQLIELPESAKRSLKVAMGGGRTYFLPNSVKDPENGAPGRRKDGRDLTAEWVGTRGPKTSFVWDKAQFDAIDPAHTEYLLGLFENSHMQYEADRGNDKAGEPSLAEMTEKAIKLLSRNPRGFYLQVEAGRIDHAHHAGNAKRALLDTIEFSRAIKKAYEMTDPEETLIIVTADHSHTFTIAGYPHRGNNILGLVREVPNKDGETPQTKKDRLGLPYTTLGYANGPGWRDALASGAKRPDLSAVDTAGPSFLQEAAVPTEGAETHGGEDVAIYATGPKSHLVHGSMEQNWIYHVMREAFGF
ncbi:MAG: alkaline phosphatase [Betaproteobacteria bacterium]|nr:alkaline phosphatase [Betaproteobacteria bacterium]